MRRLVRRASKAAWAALLFASCASSPERVDYDPFEKVNRKVFAFNLWTQRWLLDPFARVWHAVLPDPAERALSRFYANLAFPIDLANNLLQLELRNAGTQTARFVVNTTAGLGGLFDPASAWGIPDRPEDLGQTLAVWGLASGPYLMLPLWGPSNPREGIGLIGDYFASLQPFVFDDQTRNILYGVQTLNAEGLDLEAAKRRREAAVDYYVFVRDGYLQRRQAMVRDSNELEQEQVDDLYGGDPDATSPESPDATSSESKEKSNP